MNSCVNKQVKAFSRKLRKQIKIFENTVLIKVDPDSDLFNGKELAAKKIVTTIKYIWNETDKETISVKWEEDHEIGKQENHIVQKNKNQGSTGEEN